MVCLPALLGSAAEITGTHGTCARRAREKMPGGVEAIVEWRPVELIDPSIHARSGCRGRF